MTISPLLRQLMVAIPPQMAAFSVGGAVVYPTILIEQFRGNHTSEQLDVNTRSWIGSISGLAGIPAILMPVLTQKIGRKYGFIATSLFLMIGWILTYTGSTTTQVLISESFHGLGINSLLPVSFLGMTEMLAPKYRFISMQSFAIVQGIGMAVCGILGRYLHYQTVSLIMFLPVTTAIVIALTWPESPAWFACKGEFAKCEKAFIKLRGNDDASKKELSELITAQRENLSGLKHQTMSLKHIWEQITRRDFYMPTLHVYLLLSMLYWSGGDVVLIYYIEMVSKSTSDKNVALYAGIALYVIVLVGSALTNLSTIYFKNKTILLLSTIGVIFCLISTCIVTGLQSQGLIPEDTLSLTYCLTSYMVCNSLGLNSIVFMVGAELMPVKHRSLGGALYVIFNCSLYASSLKIAPYLFLHLEYWGTYLIYAVNAVICAILVWRFVPETKGKSLQELEDFYTHKRFIRRCDDGENYLTPINS